MNSSSTPKRRGIGLSNRFILAASLSRPCSKLSTKPGGIGMSYVVQRKPRSTYKEEVWIEVNQWNLRIFSRHSHNKSWHLNDIPWKWTLLSEVTTMQLAYVECK
jgi:hypothetical protein